MDTISTEIEQAAAGSREKLAFEFRGDGTEYFKIWIVNVLLTIVTLGIYSAWAKVRTNQYFYSNLYLNNSNFSYLADPVVILKGRVIAVIAFIIFQAVSQTNPAAGLVLLALLFISMPYFVNKSLEFNHRMSAYANIQFRFKGSYGQAAMVIFIWPLLGVLTLGILLPLAILKSNEYVINNSAYGTSKFSFQATYKDYAVIFLTAIGIAFACAVPIVIISYFIPALSFLSMFLVMCAYFAVIVYFSVSAGNLFYKSTSLLDHGFEADFTMAALTKVILLNLFFTLITFGLYLPAAKVRIAKYISSCLVMHAAGDLQGFSAAEKENVSALGEEFGQVFDFA
ncbi:YjgN family protein [Psychromonas aquimarina]|uniref:YjgN family protein n=1 Tax=Psychromonas aquimarina TaxID=444919 RepID=UPI0004084DCD|nr:YjgN family protein [Psychromonas aquimarina]